ncbi:LCP family protein [Arthrobacter sp. M4]|uniref:LCP family protein n=1 Tax=Arthrobacter sp. M4 TaxID=218160 RepID=UPI001CDCA4A2|nr:LCP family protein [Arthrobacter sp. M4]MCA4133390.1 LCP family protein [Arthrobacter sp. M4]
MSDAIGPQPTGDDAQRQGRPPRRLLIGVVAALLLIVGAVAAFMLLQRPSSPTAPSPTQTLPELPPGPMNILVLGSDIRGNAREALQRQEATGEQADERSDMIMLVHIPADRHKVYGISILRDNWVKIPGHGDSKINESLTFGGPRLVADTVGSLLGTHIDHYAMLDFDGFKNLTDALGGVDVNVTAPFTATFDTHHTFAQGINKLDGQAALEFVRERKAFPDGDYQRARNQQTYVRSVMTQLLHTGKVTNPTNALELIKVVSPHLIVDPGFDSTALASVAYALRSTDPAASVFFTLPTAGTGTSPDGQSIVLPDYAGIAEVAAALKSDGLAGYAASHGL